MDLDPSGQLNLTRGNTSSKYLTPVIYFKIRGFFFFLNIFIVETMLPLEYSIVYFEVNKPH